MRINNIITVIIVFSFIALIMMAKSTSVGISYSIFDSSYIEKKDGVFIERHDSNTVEVQKSIYIVTKQAIKEAPQQQNIDSMRFEILYNIENDSNFVIIEDSQNIIKEELIIEN